MEYLTRPKVIIIGGGFGGLNAALALSRAQVDITLLDRTNHHLFQPLLYQVATAGLNPADIAEPIRHVLRKQKNVEIVLGDVKRIDKAHRKVITEDLVFNYDFLIVATGARHSYFGHPEWETHAPGLKNLEDALELRKRILTAFEQAEKALTSESRRAALTFVVVGAGPTGVEMAGAIAELARFTLVKDFKHIDPKGARVVLVDAAPRVLPMFKEDLSAKALEHLRELGVEVHLDAMVEEVTESSVTFGEKTIESRTIVWAAGNAASPLGKMLGETDKAGRVLVEKTLAVKDHPEVFAIGDLASLEDAKGQSVPAVSPAAIQMGRHAAMNIQRAIAGKEPHEFKYLDKGNMATIGRHAAVADLHVARFGGFLAWLAWLLVHLMFLVGFRNRAAVFLQWAYAYFTYGKGARLITGKAHQNAKEGVRIRNGSD